MRVVRTITYEASDLNVQIGLSLADGAHQYPGRVAITIATTEDDRDPATRLSPGSLRSLRSVRSPALSEPQCIVCGQTLSEHK